MEEYISNFLSDFQIAKGYTRNTLDAYRNDLKQFLNFALNEQPHLSGWTRVDKPLLLSFILHLKERGYTPASVSRKVTVLKTFYHYLVGSGVVADDPTATLDSPRFEKQPPKILTEDQVERLLAAPAEKISFKCRRDRAILELLYATGLRVSELVALDLTDLHLDQQTLHCTGHGGKRRVLVIPPRAGTALQEYLELARTDFSPQPNETALFLNPQGERLTRQGLWLIIREYVRRAEITAPVTPHILRHSFAAHALNRGENLENLSRMLGHSNVTTTKVYARLAEPVNPPALGNEKE
ncbi:MAG: tyrosine-type recombinase/integrase [Chloroflexi bacterium]|nr:tyrosine-type recombinase/integrase [Chloroflexota bacterium]